MSATNISVPLVKKPSFLREVFSENGEGSASRLMMLGHFLAGSGWITHFVAHNHALPDPTTMASATAFIVAPYAVNAGRTMVTAFAPKTP